MMRTTIGTAQHRETYIRHYANDLHRNTQNTHTHISHKTHGPVCQMDYLCLCGSLVTNARNKHRPYALLPTHFWAVGAMVLSNHPQTAHPYTSTAFGRSLINHAVIEAEVRQRAVQNIYIHTHTHPAIMCSKTDAWCVACVSALGLTNWAAGEGRAHTV